MSGTTNIDANAGSLAQLPIFIEGAHRGGFMVREANGLRSRDLAILANSGAAAITYPAGLVLEIATAQNGATPAGVAPYAAGTAAGTPAAILFDITTVPAGGSAKVTIISRDAEVNAAELAYDASVATTAAQATILAALAKSGVIGR
jgi:hypothetical protein